MIPFRKYVIYAILCIIAIAGLGCPAQKTANQSENYHIGTWTGAVNVQARITEKVTQDYWNGAWKVEANVSLDEFKDGSLKGTAECNLFGWDSYAPSVMKFEEITTRQWDKYAVFDVELTGNITSKGYELHAGELPKSLPNSRTAGGIINIWDFLYPKDLIGEWPAGGSQVMEGESVRPQGADIKATSGSADFRKSDVKYTWSINRL